MSLSLIPKTPQEALDEGERLGRAAKAKESVLALATARHASLVASDAKLVGLINETLCCAANPEPRAADFGKLSDWHTAVRKWQAERPAIEATLAVMETSRVITLQDIRESVESLSGHRLDLARVESEAAKFDSEVAKEHAKLMAARADYYQSALWLAGRAA